MTQIYDCDTQNLTDTDHVDRTMDSVFLAPIPRLQDYLPGEREQEAAEYDAATEVRRVAIDTWFDGKCCGHADRRTQGGLCTLVGRGCYECPHGRVLAKRDWEEMCSFDPELQDPWMAAQLYDKFFDFFHSLEEGTSDHGNNDDDHDTRTSTDH